MNDFLKAAALILIAVVLCLIISGQNKHYSTILSMAVCIMVSAIAMMYLDPVFEFLDTLQALGNWNKEFLSILLKASGIAIITQIVNMLCADAGNAALGKSIQLLSTAVILWLSLPLFTDLINLINELLASI